MNKKIFAFATAGALALALAGCSVGGSSMQESASSAAAEAASSLAASSSAAEPATSSQQTGMINPWQDAASAEEAAQGAGLDSFSVPEANELTIGPMGPWTFRYMDGLAEAEAPAGAAEVLIRKGQAAEPGDASGDYGEYPLQWTQNIKGLDVTCFGFEEDMAHKILWSLEGTDYSILVFGQGDVYDTFGLGSEDVSSLVNGIQ